MANEATWWSKGNKATADVESVVGRTIEKSGLMKNPHVKMANKWFMGLTPQWKIAMGFGVALMGLNLTRAISRTVMSPEGYGPPPAYSGTYGRIEGIRHKRRMNDLVQTDFGSGIKHAQAVSRGILPGRHVNHFGARFGI